MNFTTLSALKKALQDARKPMQVALMPGLQGCRIYSLGHPEALSEKHPRAITVPADVLTGELLEAYLLRALNAHGAREITGEVSTGKAPTQRRGVAEKAPTQRRGVAETAKPQETARHQIWIKLRELGPQTRGNMAQLTKWNSDYLSSALWDMSRRGFVRREGGCQGRSVIYSVTDDCREPDFSKSNIADRKRRVIDALKNGPMTRTELAKKLKMSNDKLTLLLTDLNHEGRATYDQPHGSRRITWRLTEGGR